MKNKKILILSALVLLLASSPSHALNFLVEPMVGYQFLGKVVGKKPDLPLESMPGSERYSGPVIAARVLFPLEIKLFFGFDAQYIPVALWAGKKTSPNSTALRYGLIFGGTVDYLLSSRFYIGFSLLDSVNHLSNSAKNSIRYYGSSYRAGASIPVSLVKELYFNIEYNYSYFFDYVTQPVGDVNQTIYDPDDLHAHCLTIGGSYVFDFNL